MQKLKIEYVDINKLTPYKNNARIHSKEQIEKIAKSIKEFGFINPVLIDGNYGIIAGHGRVLGANKLGLKEIPCIFIETLTEAQKRAYIIVDNKLSEDAGWDFNLLNIELDGLKDLDFDVDLTGFELNVNKQKEKDEEKDFHRDNTIKQYNLEYYDVFQAVGKYQMPIIKRTNYIPKDLIGFNYMLSSENKYTGIHCFVDDYQFERLWREPMAYIDKISEYDCFLSPDFSLYMDMPYAMKIWNVYRSRLLGQLYQNAGIEVIPTISWAEEETFEFCFDGIEQGSTVAISTIGVKQSKEAFKIWKAGMDEMIKRLKPTTIICYGGEVEYNYQGIKVIYFENKITEKLRGKLWEEEEQNME